MNQRLETLQQLFATDIPISNHLGIVVVSYCDGCLTLEAPLQANSNPHSTVFAGSLNAATTLAGWGQLWLILKEHEVEAEIVIQNSAIEYLKPVTRNFTVRCCRPEAAKVERLLKALSRKGKARQELCAEVYEAEQRAVTFTGRYIATLL